MHINWVNAMDIDEKARLLAKNICKAFQLHDEKKYDEVADIFGEIYTHLYDDVEKEKCSLAGFHEMESLRKHDLIEDARNTSAEKILNEDDWSDVYKEFKKISELLGIKAGFAADMTEFYRYHTAGKKEHFILHCLEAQKLNGIRLIGEENKKLARVLAALFYVGVEAHDAHSAKGWEIAENIMYVYYKTALEIRQKHL